MDDQKVDREGGVSAVAMALLSLAIYLELRDSTFTKENDAQALEEVRLALKDATPAEIESLAAASKAYGFPWWPKDMGLAQG